MCKNKREIDIKYDKNEEKFDSETFHKKVKHSYTHVMKAYSKYCEKKTKQISFYRTIFFWGIIVSFCIFSIITLVFLGIAIKNNNFETIIPALITFLANILIFPIIIARYLFNHKEDKEFLHLYQEYFAQVVKKETEEIKATALKGEAKERVEYETVDDEESNIDIDMLLDRIDGYKDNNIDMLLDRINDNLDNDKSIDSDT